MPFYTTPLLMMTWPMQASAMMWSAYWRTMSEVMSATLPPGAAEASDAAAAGVAAVTKGSRTPV